MGIVGTVPTGGTAMPDRYVAKTIDARQIDQAFPVVQSCVPGLDIARWRRFAAELVGSGAAARRRGGIVTAQLGRGYIHGLFCYMVVPSLCHGRVLQVENFVALDMFDPAATADRLMAAMEELARELGCGAIHVMMRDRRQGGRLQVLERFQETGHETEGLHLCKPLRGAAE